MHSGDGESATRAVLESVACADSDVSFVVAFGSRLSGTATESSDLDIAVKFDDELSDGERFDKRCFLSGELQSDEAPFVDISDIETVPLDVAHDAVNGTFVCGDSEAFERFKRGVESRYTDRRDERRRGQRGVIDRIAEDGLRG
ncbi:MAG: type VII toxin-antitoxin system MntA family adenylyltransferase antitoxin [Haloferacaceae archaeon]